MALPAPPPITNPIPNNPFYSPLTNALQSLAGPLIVGSGITIDYAISTISVTGGGGGGSVSSVSGVAPIVVVNGTTTPTLSITAATTSALGAVELATLAEVSGGTNNTNAVTPDTLATVYMPKTGGTFTGPVTFNSALTANGTTRITGPLTTTSTVTNCGAVTNCSSVTTSGTTTNIGPVINCTLVTNCNNVVTCGTTTNVGQVTNCALVTNCGNVITNGTTTNIGSVTNCAATTLCGPTTFCNTATFTCPATFCQPVTFCSTPILPAGVPLGCALCVTYSNTTSGLTATNVQAAIDELTALGAAPATTTALGLVCIGSNVNVTGAGQISVNNAGYAVPTDTTSVKGVVQIYNALDAGICGCALDACQGKILQSQITALAVTGGVSLAGTIDANNGGRACSLTSGGSGAGFVVGSVLPAASATTNNYYVIVTTAGTFTPPGGVATAATQGDWFLVAEPTPGNYAWEFLNVGFDAPLATTSSLGIVQLATNVQAQTGLDTANAVTSAALQSKLSDSISISSSTTIASSTAVKTAYDLANAAIPKSAVTGKGALVSGTAASTISTLTVGGDNQMLVACGTATTGLCWINQPAAAIPCATILAKGDIVIGSAAATPTALTVGTNGQVLTACSTAPNGLCWVSSAAAAIPCSTLNAKGALITTSTPSTPVALPVGTDGTILTACSAAATGLCWVSGSNLINSVFTAKGDILVGTGAGTFSALPVGGTAGQVLTVDSTCANGVKWAAGGGGGTDATPEVAGTLKGCTNSINAVTYLGCFAGCSAAGSGGVFIGACAGRAVTAPCTVLIGNNAGGCSSNLSSAVFIGQCAGWCYINGANVIAVGAGAARAHTSGSCNIAIGSFSGGTDFGNPATGQKNVSIGSYAALSLGSGSANVLIGDCAAILLTDGSNNVSIGSCVGQALTNGSFNTLVGDSVGCTLTTGSNNVLIGCGVQAATAITNCTLAIGFSATSCWLTGDATKAIKPGAGVIDCAGCCGTAGQVLTSTGVNSICWRGGAGGATATRSSAGLVFGCTDNTFNVGLGLNVFGTGLTTNACHNIAFGAGALGANTQGCFGIAIGTQALCSSAPLSGNTNIAIGVTSGTGITTGVENTLVGYCAGNVGNFSSTTAIGACAAIGTNGGCGVAIGVRAGGTVLGVHSVVVGFSAGCCAGSCSTYIGSCAGCTATNTMVNNVALGYNAQPAAAANNTITLGNASITQIRAAVNSISFLSDARDKTDVVALPLGLDFIKALKPVKFTWQMREPNEVKDGTSETGFIAQELQEAEEQFGAKDYLGLVYDIDPERLEASWGKLLPVLVKAIQELSAEVTALRSELYELKQ